MKVFVRYAAVDHANALARATSGSDPAHLRQLRSRQEAADEHLRTWANGAGAGGVVSSGDGEGLLEVPASKLGELDDLRSLYGRHLSSACAMGVGTKMPHADLALRVAIKRGGDRVMLYRPELHSEVSEEKQREAADPLSRIIEHEQAAEKGAAMEKAEAPAMNTGPGAGFQGGGHMAVGTPATPTEGTSDHSEGQVAQDEVADQRDLEEQFHTHAQQQLSNDQQTQATQAQNVDGIKAQVAQVLEQLRGQAPVLAQIKQKAPQTFQAVTALIQSVVAMGRALSPPQPMQKMEGLTKAEGEEHPGLPSHMRWYTEPLLRGMPMQDSAFTERQSGAEGSLQPGQHTTIRHWQDSDDDEHLPGHNPGYWRDAPGVITHVTEDHEHPEGRAFHIRVQDGETGEHREFVRVPYAHPQHVSDPDYPDSPKSWRSDIGNLKPSHHFWMQVHGDPEYRRDYSPQHRTPVDPETLRRPVRRMDDPAQRPIGDDGWGTAHRPVSGMEAVMGYDKHQKDMRFHYIDNKVVLHHRPHVPADNAVGDANETRKSILEREFEDIEAFAKSTPGADDQHHEQEATRKLRASGSIDHLHAGQRATLLDYTGTGKESEARLSPATITQLHVDENHFQGPRVYAVTVRHEGTGEEHVALRHGETWGVIKPEFKDKHEVMRPAAELADRQKARAGSGLGWAAELTYRTQKLDELHPQGQTFFWGNGWDGEREVGPYTHMYLHHAPHTAENDEVGDDPMRKVSMQPNKTGRHNLQLPVGTAVEGGPHTTAKPGEVGKLKVKHGTGDESWKQMRAGMVTATADTHAPPTTGTVNHPTSSRNPKGR